MNKIIITFIITLIANVLHAQMRQGITSWIGTYSDGNSNSSASNTIIDVQTNNAGEVYVLGSFKDSIDLDHTAAKGVLYNSTNTQTIETYLAKYNAAGQLQFAKVLATTTSKNDFYGDQPSKMKLINGNIYVIGYLSGERDFDNSTATAIYTKTGYGHAYMAVYDTAGAFVNAKVLNGNGAAFSNFYDITKDGGSNIYLCGYYNNSVDFNWGAGAEIKTGAIFLKNYGFVLKVNVTNDFEQVYTLNGNNESYCKSLVVSDNGEVYVGGTFKDKTVFNQGTTDSISSGASGIDAGFLLKINSTNSYEWVNIIKGINNKSINAVIDNKPMGGAISAVYITGTIGDTTFFIKNNTTTQTITSGAGTDVFLAKVNADGTYAWIKTMDGNGTAIPYSLKSNPNINAIALGIAQYSGLVDYNLGADTFAINGAANISAVLDTNGNFKWANSTVTSGQPNTYNTGVVFITPDVDTSLISFGGWQGTLDCNSVPNKDSIITAANGINTFIQRHIFVAATNTSVTKLDELQNIIIYPNPTTGIVYIDAPMYATCTVLNIQGQVLQQQAITKSINAINLSKYNNAIYFIKISNALGAKTIKVILGK